MANNIVKNEVVLTDINQVQTIGELNLNFNNGKIMSIAEYLKMMVELSQCGVQSSLVLTFNTKASE